MLLPNGGTVDTHGPDVAPAGGGNGGGNPPPSTVYPPACLTDATGRFHNQLVYAVAADKPDRSAALAAQLRDMVNQSNTLLHQEAAALGGSADYKFRCDAPGVVSVAVARLTIHDADAAFWTIVGDLQAQGYDDPRVDYWVWYDSTKPTVLGQGTLTYDDRLTSNNGNARGNQFAVTYGVLDWTIMMHEAGHNQGAVQRSAPNTSNAGHCNDGKDVMCYYDGGSGNYTESVCTDKKRFDCGHDDYFHPNPPVGNYLHGRWNLAHPFNRFMTHGTPNLAPAVRGLSCYPLVVDVDEPAWCSFWVDDDGDGVVVQVSSDSGAPTRYPATGWGIAGPSISFQHAWSTLGNHTLRIDATDDGSPALASAPATVTVRVGCTFIRSGGLLASLAGAEVDNVSARWENALPRACELGGGTYALQATSSGADLDVCWHGDAGLIRCDRNPGDERGAIPVGTTAARVILSGGARASYLLEAWP